MVPQDLQIKKLPTTLYTEDFTSNWNDILTDFSLKLMKLILSFEEKALEDVRRQMKDTQVNIQQYTASNQFADLDKRLKQKLQDLESMIVKTKRSKLDRHTVDYE